jgi:hypothetical protein
MLIWLTKNLWNWSDHITSTNSNTNVGVDVSLKLDPAQLARQLEERGLPPSIFGCDVPRQVIDQVNDPARRDAGSPPEGPAPPSSVAADAQDDPLPMPEPSDPPNALEAARRDEEQAWLNSRMLAHLSRYG